jgi:uncharacterized membrane protein
MRHQWTTYSDPYYLDWAVQHDLTRPRADWEQEPEPSISVPMMAGWITGVSGLLAGLGLLIQAMV